LTYSLAAGAPAGASITPAGVFSWTPTEAQGPGTYNITVQVTDSGTPPLSDRKTFTVTVNELNRAPVLTAIANRSVDEETLLTFAASATDTDLPAQILTYSLAAGAPDGASVTPAGVFSWPPTEAQGPGTYPITVQVTDNGTPPLSDSKTFTITVNEMNRAPVLTAIENQVVEMGHTLNLTAQATDADLPAQALTFTLAEGPEGMSIHPDIGVLTWTPASAQGPSTNRVTVRVSDGALTDAKSFTVVVRAATEVRITLANRLAEGGLRMQWTTEPGAVYRVVSKQQLTDTSWVTLCELTATGSSAGITNNMHGQNQCFLIIQRIR
jgi:hypothetical protein